MLTVLLGILILGVCESKTLDERVKILEDSFNARLDVLRAQFKGENDALKLQLNTIQDRFVAENEILKSQVRDLESQVVTLASENMNLKTRVEVLDTRFHAFKNPENGVSATKIELMLDEDNSMQIRDTAYSIAEAADENQADRLNTEQQIKENNGSGVAESKLRHPSKRIGPDAPSTKVAFSAHMSKSQCYNTGQTYIYDVIDINAGHCYSSTDGIFDAPVSGVYVFTWTTATNHRNYVVTELVVNGVRMGTGLTDGFNVDAIQQSTAVMVVQVNAGDHVFVRQLRNGGDCSVMSTQDVISRFSGWLLHDTQ